MEILKLGATFSLADAGNKKLTRVLISSLKFSPGFLLLTLGTGHSDFYTLEDGDGGDDDDDDGGQTFSSVRGGGGGGGPRVRRRRRSGRGVV